MKKGNTPGMAPGEHETPKLHTKIDFKSDKGCGVTAHNRKQSLKLSHCPNCGKVVPNAGDFCNDRCADQWESYQEDTSIDELHEWQEGAE